MARIGEAFGNHKNRFLLSVAGLMLSTGMVLLWVDPLLTSIVYRPMIYANFSLLTPINFYLNLLLLLLHVMTHDHVPRSPNLFFLMKHLPQAAQAISFATLVLSVHLFMHAAVYEESIAFAIGVALVCFSLFTILSSFFKKLMNCGGFIPGFFALCMSTAYLLSYQFPTHLLLLFVSFVTLILSITLVILRIGAPSASHAENFITVGLSVAIGTLIVGGYLEGYVTATDMATVAVKAREL